VAYFKRAFSMIELVIVLVMVSILAAIATPAYKTYLIQSKFAEIFTSLGPYKVETIQAFYNTGQPPASRIDNKGSLYLNQVGFPPCTNVGFIVAFPQNFYPEWTANDRLILLGQYQNGTVSWTCCLSQVYPVPAKYLPGNCQSTCAFSEACFTMPI
jgi:prepilin-type N-terminal cleavage/methylation domain-containing protein